MRKNKPETLAENPRGNSEFEPSVGQVKNKGTMYRDEIYKGRPITRKKYISEPISRLQNELRQHSHARRKTDLAIKDIEHQLKDLLLVHHAAIRDLQKQVTQIRKRISTGDASKKSLRLKSSTRRKSSSNYRLKE